MGEYVRKNSGAVLVLLMLFSAVLLFTPIQRVMATPAIAAIDPKSGFVGNTITIDGTIDTQNGFFTIRWNQTLNVTASSRQAVDFSVHTSFTVPQTVGAPATLGRNVTIELIDDLTGASPPVNFTLFTKFDMSVTAPATPRQIQEGSTVPIAVNVTGGEAKRVYTANITVRNPANQNTSILAKLSNTTTIGYGNVTTDFSGVYLNYTGKYVVTSNVTSAFQEFTFTVGLTDKLEYRRNETVQIQASGYHPDEIARVNIETAGSSQSGFPLNVTADSSGLLKSSWRVPLNAAIGNYTVSVTNSTSSGTVKQPLDAQTFDVFGLLCKVRTINRLGEGVQNALVETYNATVPNVVLLQGSTNSTGWVGFNLDDGNYTFKAFYRNVNLAVRANESLSMDTNLEMQLDLVDLAATVETESAKAVPFVNVALKYSFTTRVNKTVSDILSASTNLTGEAELHNLFTNKTYVVEARRYDLLFSNTTLTIGPSPASPLQSLALTLPTYVFNVQALDAQDAPVSDIQIEVYEWTSGLTTPLESLGTNNSGYASFSLPFGIYRLRAYKSEVFLDETVLHLVKNQLNFSFNLQAVNVDVTVSVFDYFGRPISNAEVRIERKGDQEYVPVDSKSTGADGSVLFSSIPLAGDSRISVYVAGRLAAAKTQFLGADSSRVTFNIGEYVAILGYPIETAVFTMLLLIVALVIVSLVLLNRKRLSRLLSKKPKK